MGPFQCGPRRRNAPRSGSHHHPAPGRTAAHVHAGRDFHVLAPARRRRGLVRALERPHHPGDPLGGRTPGRGQHGRHETERARAPLSGPFPRRHPPRGRLPARCLQRRDDGTRRGAQRGRGAHRRPQGAAGELHGLHPRRALDRRARRSQLDTRSARARWQELAGGPRRRRPRLRGRRHRFRRLHELGPDLHVS